MSDVKQEQSQCATLVIAETAVVVYEKPGCPPCWATARDLNNLGVEYTPKLLADASDDQIKAWQAQGLMEAPIVVTPDETWSGYRPDKIKALTQQTAA